MKMQYYHVVFCLIILPLLSSCAGTTVRSEQAMGAAAGTAVGGGAMALLHAPKPMLFAGALVGGAIGYYVTSAQFEERNITAAGGQVFQMGQRVGVDIPSSTLFDTESSEFLPAAPLILNNVATVLSHYPNHRVVVSVHTNGMDRVVRERPLTVRQADAVTQYLRANGVSVYREQSIEQRQWSTVGRAFDAPIANSITLKGIRENSHIHIMAYPSLSDLHADERSQRMQNIGAFKD